MKNRFKKQFKFCEFCKKTSGFRAEYAAQLQIDRG